MNNVPESRLSQEFSKESEKFLSPEELKRGLVEIEEFAEQACEEWNAKLCFPEGVKMGDEDLSGLPIAEVIARIRRLIDDQNYEPQVMSAEEGDTIGNPEQQEQVEEVPVWLEGHEGLIWRGKLENPTWKVRGRQTNNGVRISYLRRQQELRPGHDNIEQSRGLDAVPDLFTAAEWEVASRVFEKYEKLLNDAETAEGEKREKARHTIAQILHEYNISRFRSEETREKRPNISTSTELPESIYEFLKDTSKEIKRTTRGFEEPDLDVLTGKVEKILSQLVVLNRFRTDGSKQKLKVESGIKEIPSFELALRELSQNFDWQLQDKKGITWLIGEAGTGKNELIKYFAAKTNRPYFWFPCARGLEASELVAHYEFDSEEGTKRFLTALAEGIQTPGAVVFIDEVNALKREVQAALHGLGDSSRSLNYDGINIPVAEGVLIIAAGNPATYGSAGDLGEALLSRTRGQAAVMEYPAFTKGELEARRNHWSKEELEAFEQKDNSLREIACDEALVLKDLLNEFAGIPDDIFSQLWDGVVNKNSNSLNNAKKNAQVAKLYENVSSAEHLQKTIIDLANILKIADIWRSKYAKREAGMDRVAPSLRDTIALTKKYAQLRDVAKTYLDVYRDYEKNPIEGLSDTYNKLRTILITEL